MISIRDAVDQADALHHLQRAVRYACTPGSTIDGAIRGAHVLDVVSDDAVVGAVAVRIEGECATVTAFASQGAFASEQWPVLREALSAKGVRHVGLYTKRPGMIRALLRAGFRVRNCELELELEL